MVILTIRTDKPNAEIGLYENDTAVEVLSWQADRQLAETLHLQIEKLLVKHAKHLSDVEAIACYEGPGSFTGLRIGMSVANALAYGLAVPIVTSGGDGWPHKAIADARNGRGQKIGTITYGSEPHVSSPKK